MDVNGEGYPEASEEDLKHLFERRKGIRAPRQSGKSYLAKQQADLRQKLEEAARKAKDTPQTQDPESW